MTSIRGAYALVLALAASRTVQIGRLGTFAFPEGFYLYLGSALGPGGLASRLTRHRRIDEAKPRRWHIDFLRAASEWQEVWTLTTHERVECQWAAAASHLPGATIPVPGMGASDCECLSHLVHLPHRPEVDLFAAAVGARLSRVMVMHGPRPSIEPLEEA